MKIIRFEYKGEQEYGYLRDEIINILTGDIFSDAVETDTMVALEEVKVLPPVIPSKIVALGLNYEKHAREAGFDIPEEPLIFLKPPSAIIAHLEHVIYPANTDNVHYEGELGVVIGKKAHHVSEDEALDYVLGYTIVNDVSAREYQHKDGQWTRGKGYDTFCPVGPVIAAGLDPDNLDIKTRLNGKTVQDSNTNDMIFKTAHQISFISHVMTLIPGDLIITGTPLGVGPFNRGDCVEIEVEGIGVLKNFIS